jgi:hypothetical protein
MKITNELLDNLIAEQVNLKEDTYNLDDLFATSQSTPKGSVSPKSAFDTLRRLKDPKAELTDEDFDYLMDLLDIDPAKLDTNIESKLIAVRKAASNADLRQRADDVLQKLYGMVDKTALGQQSVTQPQIQTAKAAQGTFNSEIDNILRTFFSGGETMLDRIKKISEISLKYYNAATGKTPKINNANKREMLTEIMLLDYLAEVTKSFDSGAGGYLFEYFLALLGGGKVTGKSSGPGQGMGAVDFDTSTGEQGSSKYYRNKDGMTQAAGGFEIGVPVTYIIALKKQASNQIKKTTLGTADPAKIIALDIYHVKIKRVSKTEFRIYPLTKTGQASQRTNAKQIMTVDSKGNLTSSLNITDMIKGLPLYLTTIYIASVRTETFKDMVYDAVSQSNQEVISFLENYVSSLRTAEQSCKKYATPKGTVQDGQNAFDALFSADEYLEEIVLALDPNKTIQGSSQAQSVNENNEKITPELLDKLIKAVILNK